jgi:hypothetical protein
MKKQKIIVLSILSFIAIASSYGVLVSDGYFNKKKVENKVLSVEEQAVLPITNPVVLAKGVTEVKKAPAKTITPVKKAPVKKAPAKKVVKKKSVNLNPPKITPATAPFSEKKK